jgi:hypothetical protein
MTNEQKKIEGEIDLKSLYRIISSFKIIIFFISLLFVLLSIYLTNNFKVNYELSVDLILGQYDSNNTELQDLQSELSSFPGINIIPIRGEREVRLQIIETSKERGVASLRKATDLILKSSDSKAKKVVALNEKRVINLNSKINFIQNEIGRLSNLNIDSNQESLSLHGTKLDLLLRLSDLKYSLNVLLDEINDPNYIKNTQFLNDIKIRVIESKRYIFIFIGSFLGFLFSIFVALIIYAIKNRKLFNL